MKRNKFALSHFKENTMNMGKLVPIGLVEALPGDTIQHSTSALVRVNPLNSPVMHPVHVNIHHWFVPFRLLWDNWEKFITGGPDGMDNSVLPYIEIGGGAVTVGSLADYLGVPRDNNLAEGAIKINALPFRAYDLIFNEWYRDQDLTTPLTISKADGADTTTDKTLQACNWEKDYITTCRPWTQKGPDVTLPLGESAPVVSDGTSPKLKSASYGPGKVQIHNASNAVHLDFTAAGVGNEDAVWDAGNTGLEADLSGAVAPSINTIRTAFGIMRYEEARARYGSRYTEYLAYLGVKSSDARLQRPEYLGGGRQTIQFSEVLQTAPVSGTGVGNLLGHGIGAMRSNRYRRFIEEHGYIVSLMSVMPIAIYEGGLHRLWSRTTKEDFWQKELEHIGQQPVYNKELNMNNATTPEGVWGYQDRYDDYRRMGSSIHGKMRTTFNTWNMARIFGGNVSLNNAFLREAPTTRIYQATSEDQLLVMAKHSIQARRMLSKVGTPFTF